MSERCNGTMRNGPDKRYARCQKCSRVDYEANEGDRCKSARRCEMALTDDDRTGMFAMIAQGVINIESGINNIEPGSRIHRAMMQFCEELTHYQEGKEPCPCCGRRPAAKSR